MDRIIEKKKWSTGRLLLIFGSSTVILALAWMIFNQAGKTRLKVDTSRMTIARVEYGEFQEYYPSSGWVEPETSVFLDVEEGGRVDEIFVEGGQFVRKGDLILRFSNVALQRQSIDTETRLLENLDQQRNTQFIRTQSQLLLKEALLDLEYQILELEKKYKRYQALMQQKQNNLSIEQFEAVRDELDYRREKRSLLQERIRQEDLLGKQQLIQANQSIERLDVALELLNMIVESMDVRAPITGHLSSIDAEIGQNINKGQRIGQIDVLDRFKIRVEIDQYYLTRVNIGTRGKFELDGNTYAVVVKKIYPEVTNNIFRVDLAFDGEPPSALRRGQELTVELSFSEPSQSLMVAKGGFYQQTSGRWVYLISADGASARRTAIRLGRQNPRHVEVLEGLQEGDRIITSGYDSFNEVDELQFNQSIEVDL
jgi:HlyD family secretion protein